MFDVESFWAEMLSREPERIQAAFNSLPQADEKAAVLAHLNKMVSEKGWAEPQRISAEAALKALE